MVLRYFLYMHAKFQLFPPHSFLIMIRKLPPPYLEKHIIIRKIKSITQESTQLSFLNYLLKYIIDIFNVLHYSNDVCYKTILIKFAVKIFFKKYVTIVNIQMKLANNKLKIRQLRHFSYLEKNLICTIFYMIQLCFPECTDNHKMPSKVKMIISITHK